MASVQAKSNAKRREQKRHWCFTSYLDLLPSVFDKCIVRYCIYQREICEETKRPHWQGYIEFHHNYRRGQVINVLGACHLEPRYATRSAAREYCRKKASAIANTQVEFGEWRVDIQHRRKLSDLLDSHVSLDDLIKEAPVYYVRYHRGLEKLYAYRNAQKAKEFRFVKVAVYLGPTGTGKTRKALEEPDHFKLPLSDKIWFDCYAGESCLVIDDFYGNIRYSHLLNILDGHELLLPVKGSFIWANWTKVIITSNREPCDWYKMMFGLPPALERRLTNNNTTDYIRFK